MINQTSYLTAKLRGELGDYDILHLMTSLLNFGSTRLIALYSGVVIEALSFYETVT